MARQSPEHTRKLVVFVAFVVSCLLGILWNNLRIRRQESALSQGGGALREGLERMRQAPDRLAMTMRAGLPDERILRHVGVHTMGKVDVLVLGQSDADHMSATFFNEGTGFYNGFLSSSFFAYQYDVFEEIARSQGVPEIVLVDVRSGYMLLAGDEPPYDAPADDKVWSAGAPWSHGSMSIPWYRDVDSLLSWQQTLASLRVLTSIGDKQETASGNVDVEEPFSVTPDDVAAPVHRWRADGSRIYPGEVADVIVPGSQERLDYATGDRQLNALRVARLGEFLDLLRRSGAVVIVYSPPLSPRVFEASTPIADVLLSMDGPVRKVIEARGIDYCDLATEARALGCTRGDFFDALHLSRACDRKVVRRLAEGCASRAGAVLRARLSDSVFRD